MESKEPLENEELTVASAPEVEAEEATEAAVAEPESKIEAAAVTTPPANGSSGDSRSPRNLDRILDIQLPVTVSFGSTNRPLNDILKFAPGTLIELDKTADDPVLLKVNGKVFAWGKVVDVDGYYGVEITQIIHPVDRIASLGGEQ